jgi:hypothetical protein
VVKGAWRSCTYDLVTAFAVKVAFFYVMQFCTPSAKVKPWFLATSCSYILSVIA